jgi:hypothetical protein
MPVGLQLTVKHQAENGLCSGPQLTPSIRQGWPASCALVGDLVLAQKDQRSRPTSLATVDIRTAAGVGGPGDVCETLATCNSTVPVGGFGAGSQTCQGTGRLPVTS